MKTTMKTRKTRREKKYPYEQQQPSSISRMKHNDITKTTECQQKMMRPPENATPYEQLQPLSTARMKEQ